MKMWFTSQIQMHNSRGGNLLPGKYCETWNFFTCCLLLETCDIQLIFLLQAVSRETKVLIMSLVSWKK